MLCKWNDDVTYYALFTACKKVSCHELIVASMQCTLREGNSLAFQTLRSESVGNWCIGKGIQSAYFRYNSDISKCKRSLFALYHASLTLLVTNSLECYVDASTASDVIFPLHLSTLTGKLINIDIFDEAN